MLLHNMSAPPRTEVRAEKRGIADRIVVFSLIYALTVRGFLEKRERPEKLPSCASPIRDAIWIAAWPCR